MNLTVTNSDLFQKMVTSLCKFIDKARFDFRESGVRIRSIDSEDFCYIDIRLSSSFFASIEDVADITLVLDISGMSKMVKALSK
ncbi:MAG: hypothetical protein ACFFER_18145, partial [Candidatus Thorarchaeota archaeon]